MASFPGITSNITLHYGVGVGVGVADGVRRLKLVTPGNCQRDYLDKINSWCIKVGSISHSDFCVAREIALTIVACRAAYRYHLASVNGPIPVW